MLENPPMVSPRNWLALIVVVATGCADDSTTADAALGDGSLDAGYDTSPADGGREELGVDVSVVLIPRNYEATLPAWTEVLSQARLATPALMSVGYLSWRDAEIADGVFNWSEFDTFPPLTEGVVLDVASPVGFAGDLDVPAHIPFVGFDDPVLAAAYLRYMRSAADAAPGPLVHLTVHTEGVLEYFEANPTQQAGFCDLLAQTIEALRAERPGLRIGAYWRYENDDAALFECINRATDVVAVAMILNPPGDSPSSIESIVDHYVTLAAGRPLAIVEAGYPTTTYLGSSEAAQSEFLRALERSVRTRRDEIEFVAIYSVFDEDRALVERIGDSIYGPEPLAEKTILIEWLSTMGLQTDGAVPKAGWPVFLELFGS